MGEGNRKGRCFGAGFEKEALEDGKIRKDQDIEKSMPGKESNVNKGHELRLNLLFGPMGSLA